jgi:hypothetical protein
MARIVPVHFAGVGLPFCRAAAVASEISVEEVTRNIVEMLRQTQPSSASAE